MCCFIGLKTREKKEFETEEDYHNRTRYLTPHSIKIIKRATPENAQPAIVFEIKVFMFKPCVSGELRSKPRANLIH